MLQREKRRRAESRRKSYEDSLSNAIKEKELNRLELEKQKTLNQELHEATDKMKLTLESLEQVNEIYIRNWLY